MAKVSIIVPVYNADKTIERCLESLVNQTLEEIELILVNDASTDGSYEKLLEFENKYQDKIIVVNCTENQGAGGARNVGLEIASGEYVGFVDADDFVKKDMFEKLYLKAAGGHLDVVDSEVYMMKSESVREALNDIFCDAVISPEDREWMILSDGYIVSKLIRREIIEEYGIRFRTGVKLEDADFLLKVMLHADRIDVVREPLYTYDNTAENETWSVKESNEKEYRHIYELIKTYIDILKTDERAKECRQAIEGALLHFYLSAVRCCLPQSGEMDRHNLYRLVEVRDKVRSCFRGGYDNKFFGQTATEDDVELLKFVDKVKL